MSKIIAATLFLSAIILIPFLCGSSSADTFMGYECKEDCSGHRAGYDWAERKGVDSVDGCEGAKSQSFYEGCVAKVYNDSEGYSGEYGEEVDHDEDGINYTDRYSF
jgi:hypothetical protein